MDKKIIDIIYSLSVMTAIRMISCILNELTAPPTDKDSMKRFKCMIGMITCTDYANRHPDFREEIYEKHIMPMINLISSREASSDIREIFDDLLKQSDTKVSPKPDAGPRPDLN